MKRKDVINELANHRYEQAKGFVEEMEQSIVDYIREHGEIDLEHSDCRVYTTLHRWGGTESVAILGMKISESGKLIVIDEDGCEHRSDHFTLDTLFDICYCTDCWPTEE